MDCIFCKLVNGEIPSTRVYEDERTIAFMDIAPIIEGHLLVIPKRHSENIFEIDPDDLAAVFSSVHKVAAAIKAGLKPDGLTIVQLNGKASYQVVPHYHVHLIPRKNEDGLRLGAWRPLTVDRDGISAIADKIRTKI
ncbi:MAG: HIT family protein [Deltaproteobacteria bacterium]|nr:HIT family protein [Deltaproteobacteria bacterium]